jgi:hypothetical protein
VQSFERRALNAAAAGDQPYFISKEQSRRNNTFARQVSVMDTRHLSLFSAGKFVAFFNAASFLTGDVSVAELAPRVKVNADNRFAIFHPPRVFFVESDCGMHAAAMQLGAV